MSTAPCRLQSGGQQILNGQRHLPLGLLLRVLCLEPTVEERTGSCKLLSDLSPVCTHPFPKYNNIFSNRTSTLGLRRDPTWKWSLCSRGKLRILGGTHPEFWVTPVSNGQSLEEGKRRREVESKTRRKHLDAEESQGPPGKLGRKVSAWFPPWSIYNHSVETLTLYFCP